MYLAQLAIEAKYDKSTIRPMIDEEIREFDEKLQRRLQRKVHKYLDSHQNIKLKSKVNRIKHLATNSVEDIAYAILEAILMVPVRFDDNGETEAGVQPIQAVASSIGSQFFKCQLNGAKTGMELLAVCEIDDLYKIYLGSDENNEYDTAVIAPQIILEDDTLFHIAQCMYLPPMLSAHQFDIKD